LSPLRFRRISSWSPVSRRIIARRSCPTQVRGLALCCDHD
jgi:hypothetical protein